MKKVLITGASRGIGAGCARVMAANGYNVIIHYNRSGQAAGQLCAELREKGFSASVVQADLTDSAQVRAMFTVIGSVDILVNNAGIAQSKLFTELTDEDWDTMIAANLSSAFYCCRAALPYMIRQHWGRIINISSMWGQIGGSCEVHYSAAKAGIIGLTKALAMEEGPSGITINCIAPGVIQTDMTAHLSEEDFAALRDETPTGTLGTPDDIARAVLFFAADSASFITGQVLGVNGGFVI